MVTSSLGSSFSRTQELVKEAVPPSESHRDPKPSPTVNGLSLYLNNKTSWINQLSLVLQPEQVNSNWLN